MASTRHGVLALLLLAGGCSTTTWSPQGSRGERDGAPAPTRDLRAIPDAVPKREPLARTGNVPYEVFGHHYQVMKNASGYRERGVASWYGTKFDGRLTSSGEIYDVWGMTAAHRNLPLPTYARITNLDNRRSVIVKINDRGPFHSDRLIDLSYAAAAKLGITEHGTGRVEVQAIVPDADPLPARPTLARAPTPPAPSPAKGYRSSERLFLQIGAFSSQEGANRLRSQLLGRIDHGVRVQPTDAPHPLFRVQVGPLDHPGQAGTINRQLAQLGIHDTRLVSD